MAGVFFFSYTVFLHHEIDFRRGSLLRRAGERLLVVQSGVHQSFLACAQRRESAYQVLVVKAAIRMGGLRKCEGQSHQQVFFFVEKLIGDLDLKKKSGRIDLVGRARFLMLTRLPQIRAVTRAVESYFALLSATLRTDAAMHRRAKALLLAQFTNCTAQSRYSPLPRRELENGFGVECLAGL